MYNISSQVNYPVSFGSLGVGEEVTTNTMQKMAAIINWGVHQYYVRRWAERIVQDSEGDDFSRVNAIYEFLARATRYVKDPVNLELLKGPEVALKLIEVGEVPMLDCDCLTILSGSLIKSIGIPFALRATGYKNDGILTHVYGLAKLSDEGWVPFDLVKIMGFGWEASGIIRLTDVEV